LEFLFTPFFEMFYQKQGRGSFASIVTLGITLYL